MALSQADLVAAAAVSGSHARRPRVLLFVPFEWYVRALFESGAIDKVLGPDTFIVTSSTKMQNAEALERLGELPNFLGKVEDPRPAATRPDKRWGRKRLATMDYQFLREMRVFQLRDHTPLSLGYSYITRKKWRLHRVLELLGLRPLVRRFVLWRIGFHSEILKLLDDLRPDIAILATSVNETFGADAIRAARKRGVPTLAIIPNWDAAVDLSSFIVKPDHMTVWGEQSREHAIEVHGFRRDRVHPIGAPGLERHFAYRAGSSPSPFPFDYALLTGTWMAFDEVDLISRLDAAIGDHDLGLKLVYRPHPQRAKRRAPDFVDENELTNVVIDPQVREVYLRHFDAYKPDGMRPGIILPPLEWYPPLLDHARFVISNLSTMLLEAALFERRLLVPVYDDKIHKVTPPALVKTTLFEGLEEIEGIEFLRSPEAVVDRFVVLARHTPPVTRSMREAVRYYVHHDDSTFADRLDELVRQIAFGEPGQALSLNPDGSPVPQTA